jgi:hypothetical protein
MKLFIKRFWGFDGITWPIVSFGAAGSLTTLLANSSPGDLMAFVGTLGEETEEHHRGRLIGLAQFGRRRMHSRKALPPDSFAAAEKGPNGDIKWPHAVLITRAWKFTDNPLPIMTQVLGRQLPMSAMSNAVLLSTDERDRVLALPRQEVDVGLTQAIREERAAITEAIGPGGTMGPIPSSYTSKVVKDADKEAATYAFRFGSKNVWKVGWAHSAGERLKQLNAHVPHEVLGQRWGGGLIEKWASAKQAYEMEQRVLSAFPTEAKFGERVHCSLDQLDTVWRKARNYG